MPGRTRWSPAGNMPAPSGGRCGGPGRNEPSRPVPARFRLSPGLITLDGGRWFSELFLKLSRRYPLAMLIADIAHRAKVSPATVSRVINQPHLVAPDRLARVQAVMTAVNYVPTPLHRRRGPKSRLAAPKKIAVWFVGAKKSSSLNWFQDQLLQVQPSNERQRIELSVLFTDTPDDLPRALAERQVDGVIIQGMEPSAACM